MEKGGLLWKTHQSSGKKGRPLGVYHPTENLSDFMQKHNRSSGVMLDFAVLSGMCRFNSRGVCTLSGPSSEKCGIEGCPVLKTPLF